MNANQKLKQIIEVILGKQPVAQATATLVDGTVIEFEVLEVGAQVFVVTEEGAIPAPDGIHEVEGGLKVETKDGIITSIVEPETEEVVEEQVAQEEATEVAQVNVEEVAAKLAELEAKVAALEAAIMQVAEITDAEFAKVEQSINEKPATTPTKVEVEQSKGKIRKSIYDFINK